MHKAPLFRNQGRVVNPIASSHWRVWSGGIAEFITVNSSIDRGPAFRIPLIQLALDSEQNIGAVVASAALRTPI